MTRRGWYVQCDWYRVTANDLSRRCLSYTHTFLCALLLRVMEILPRVRYVVVVDDQTFIYLRPSHESCEKGHSLRRPQSPNKEPSRRLPPQVHMPAGEIPHGSDLRRPSPSWRWWPSPPVSSSPSRQGSLGKGSSPCRGGQLSPPRANHRSTPCYPHSGVPFWTRQSQWCLTQGRRGGWRRPARISAQTLPVPKMPPPPTHQEQTNRQQ